MEEQTSNLKPNEIWGEYQKRKDKLDNSMYLIMSCRDTQVFITTEADTLLFVVTIGNNKIEEIFANDEKECNEMAEYILNFYIRSEEEREITFDQEDEINYRSDEIEIATNDFVEALVGIDIESIYRIEDYDLIISDFKEHCMKYLADKFGLFIYCPKLTEGKYEEYPYNNVEYDDVPEITINPDNKDDEIFLLSSDEFEKYKYDIPVIKNSWWLRDTYLGYGDENHEDAYVVTGESKRVWHFTKDSADDKYSTAIRPAIRINKSDFDGNNIGDRIIKYAFPFIIIDKNLAISEIPIDFGQYDMEYKDYDKSQIRKALLEWCEKRKR